ncbi:hypothetical protein ACMFMG_012192 [Clarireedia jacksonii]
MFGYTRLNQSYLELQPPSVPPPSASRHCSPSSPSSPNIYRILDPRCRIRARNATVLPTKHQARLVSFRAKVRPGNLGIWESASAKVPFPLPLPFPSFYCFHFRRSVFLRFSDFRNLRHMSTGLASSFLLLLEAQPAVLYNMYHDS